MTMKPDTVSLICCKVLFKVNISFNFGTEKIFTTGSAILFVRAFFCGGHKNQDKGNG